MGSILHSKDLDQFKFILNLFFHYVKSFLKVEMFEILEIFNL